MNLDCSFASETATSKILDGDFREMAFPILVASGTRKEFEKFILREGLMCSEVRRFSGKIIERNNFPREKVLLLLPGWHEDELTKYAVDRWVYGEDRYTVALPKRVRVEAAMLTVTVFFILFSAWVLLSK